MRGHVERRKLRDASTAASVASSEPSRAPVLPLREAPLPEPVEREEREGDRGHRFVDIPVSRVDHGPGHQSDFGAAPVSAPASAAVSAQPELTISQAGDPLEMEAEAVAEAVVRPDGARPAPTSRAAGHTGMARSSSASGDPIVEGPTAERVDARIAGGGQPMHAATRSYTEPRLGHSFAAMSVQTGANETDSPGPPPAPAGPGEAPGAKAETESVKTDASGTTRLQDPPTLVYEVYHGATLRDVSATLPPEPGRVTFWLGTSTEGDPITKATVDVRQEMRLPRWAERDKQTCPDVRNAWDAFASALRAHEDGHVAIDRQHLSAVHQRFVGKASSVTQAVTTQIEQEVQAAQDVYDAANDHGRTGSPPTVIDLNAGCDHAKAEAEGAPAGAAQAKLEVSKPGDPYEEEADRVADRVIRMSDGDTPEPIRGAPARVDRCAECEEEEQRKRKPPRPAEEEEPRVRRHATGGEPVTASPSLVAAAMAGGGRPLDADTRAFMEQRIGFDFGRVRIHSDDPAAHAARELRAQAFTVGSDIVFGAGHYAPDSVSGRRLLAHELTHVVQQGGGATADGGAPHLSPSRVRIDRQAAPATTPGGAAPDGSVSTEKSLAYSIGDMAADLQQYLKDRRGHREQILRHMLRAGMDRQGEELKRAYKEKSPQKDADLIADLQPGGAWWKTDAVRAIRYLELGKLRPVDKVYLAAIDAGTEWPTIERLLPEIYKDYGAAETAFALDYSGDYGKTARLPNGQQSYIGGLIESEFPSDPNAPDAIKGKAILAFGEPQSLDLIRAGTDGATLLRPLQQGMKDYGGAEYLIKRYNERYPDSQLHLHLERHLSGDDIKRSRLIFEGNYKARRRIELAMGAGIDPDEKEIWAAISEATPEELRDLRNEFKNRGNLYELLKGGLIKGLSEENLLRAEAMLGAGPDGEDSALTKLKAEGGVNGAEIVRVIKSASKPDWKTYHDAYFATGALRNFADERLSSDEKGRVTTYLHDDTAARVRYGLEHTDIEYVTLQLVSFATDDQKRAIREDPQLATRLSGFKEKDAQKVRQLLQPGGLGPEQRAAAVNADVDRESMFVLSGTAAANAVEDEQRELAITLEKAKVDGKLTPEEQAKIAALTKSTEVALSSYKGVRDELMGYLQTALDVATSLAMAAATGGAAAPVLAAAVARAALAQALIAVATKKIVLGDNFEVMSPEAAGVFLGGFVDGAMSAVGGPAAKAAIGPSLKTSARLAAREVGGGLYADVGRTILTRAAEGAISSAPGAMVKTAADDGTWKDGFTTGFTDVLKSGAEAAATGAAMQVGVGAVGDVVKLGVGVDGHNHVLKFDEDGLLCRCSPTCPNFGASAKERLQVFDAESALKVSSKLRGDIEALKQAAEVLTNESAALKSLAPEVAAKKKSLLFASGVELDAKISTMERADQVWKQIGSSQRMTIRDLDADTMHTLKRVFGQDVAIGLHSKETIASYEALRIAVDGWGGHYQAHHIVEQQILKLLNHDVAQCPAIILTRAEHTEITQKLAKFLNPTHVATTEMTKREIWEAYQEAYKAHPRWLDEVRRYFQ